MSQQKLFLQGLLIGSKQKEVINVNVFSKKYGVDYVIEVKPQDNGILPYRVLDRKGNVVNGWDTWCSNDEIERTFEIFNWE